MAAGRREKGQGLAMAVTEGSDGGESLEAHLQSDLLIDEDRPVTEGDGVAEACLPLHGLVAEVHEDLGALGVWVEEQRRGREHPTGQHWWAVLLLVVASVRGDREGTPDGVCKGTNHSVRELGSPRTGLGSPRAGQMAGA